MAATSGFALNKIKQSPRFREAGNSVQATVLEQRESESLAPAGGLLGVEAATFLGPTLTVFLI